MKKGKGRKMTEPEANARERETRTGERGWFVVLWHECGEANGGRAASHWDLMVAVPGEEKLATWQVRMEPRTWGRRVMAERIGDHRRVYLTYEGEISGGRGKVTRVDEGPAEVVTRGTVWTLRLRGTGVMGEFEVGAE